MGLQSLALKIEGITRIEADSAGNRYLSIPKKSLTVIYCEDTYSLWYHDVEVISTTSESELVQMIDQCEV